MHVFSLSYENWIFCDKEHFRSSEYYLGEIEIYDRLTTLWLIRFYG